MPEPHRQLNPAIDGYSLLNSRRFGLFSLTSLGAWVGMILAVPTLALAQPPAHQLSNQTLLAQRIVEGLPPSPAMSNPPQLPPANLPTAGSGNPAPVLLPAAPATGQSATAAEQRYLVYVNGDSPLLLDQVRRVESNAFLQNYGGQPVIQAGLFAEADSAEQRAAALASQGIGAEVVAVSSRAIAAPQIVSAAPTAAAPFTLPPPTLLPSTSIDQQLNFGQPLDLAQSSGCAETAGNSYYVVIPGSTNNIAAIEDYVASLGGQLVPDSECTIRDQTRPLGRHLRVGPFDDRSAANRWSRYFRAFALDARVDYR
jgi:hypothetical protein